MSSSGKPFATVTLEDGTFAVVRTDPRKPRAIDSVDLVGPSNINEARVVYTEADGSKRYVYYLYDQGWSRQTSTSAFFFWRMTATVPKTALQQYDAVVQSILSSFRINASTPSA